MIERAKTWTEHLQPIIPLEDLPETFNRAVKNQDSPFPINAFNLKTAFNELILEREQEQRKNIQTGRCPQYSHDPKTGMIPVVNPFNFDEDIFLPCAYCRPTEYYEARSNLINTSGEIKPLDILSVIEANSKKAS